jgi:hypothetical protein
MVMILLSDPTRADPEMAVACETLLAFTRLIQRNPLELFRVWIILGPYLEDEERKGRRANLPVCRLLDALETVGAKLTHRGRISHPATSFMIQHINVKEFKPFLKDMANYKLMLNLASRSNKVSRGAVPPRRLEGDAVAT